MNKKTKFNQTNVKGTILGLFIYIIILVILIYLLCTAGDNILQYIFSILVLTLSLIFLIGSIIGYLKGKIQILKENKYIKNTNPYIYYRDLPNYFGIGVTTLLFDSSIENYKDIVAVILDLCARKYIHLTKQNDKYNIEVLKNVDNGLLSNEKYILTLIINGDIKNINYQEWYNHCVQDGIELGLYQQRKVTLNNDSSTNNKAEKVLKTCFKISLTIAILIVVITFIGLFFEKSSKTTHDFEPLFLIIISGAFTFIGSFLISLIPVYFIFTFIGLKDRLKDISNINYKTIIENNLRKTEKGVEELHKLYSFKAFINDFGNFVDKNVDEVVLWDRYLSYAQVFGLTKEIMNSGYQQLVNNSSFQIDDIDNINLDKIELNNSKETINRII